MDQWNDENVEKLTAYLQEYMPQWTESQTKQMLHDSESAGETNQVFFTDKGKLAIKIIGQTILVNGKDITGQLGSKITHGDYSPIIEDVRNSNIAVGNKNVINTNYQALYDSLLNLMQDISTDEAIPSKEKTTAIADIETIQSQLSKEKPNTNIVKKAWEGIKKILKAYGYAKQIVDIGKLIAMLFGL